MDLGDRIKRARQAAGLTQAELAALLNVAPNSVARWESENRVPSVVMVTAIAKATAQAPSYFFEDGTA
jgi:transcriptional regulator with XRE-family HTH domain